MRLKNLPTAWGKLDPDDPAGMDLVFECPQCGVRGRGERKETEGALHVCPLCDQAYYVSLWPGGRRRKQW